MTSTRFASSMRNLGQSELLAEDESLDKGLVGRLAETGMKTTMTAGGRPGKGEGDDREEVGGRERGQVAVQRGGERWTSEHPSVQGGTGMRRKRSRRKGRRPPRLLEVPRLWHVRRVHY